MIFVTIFINFDVIRAKYAINPNVIAIAIASFTFKSHVLNFMGLARSYGRQNSQKISNVLWNNVN